MKDIPKDSNISEDVIVKLWSGLSKWATNYARANEWKIRPEYDYNDLVQEAYLKMINILSSNPELANNSEKLYAKVGAAIRHRLIDIARRRSKVKEQPASDVNDTGELYTENVGENEKLVRAIDLETAPEELKILIAFFTRDNLCFENPFGFKPVPKAGEEVLKQARYKLPRKGGRVLSGEDMLWAIVERGKARARGKSWYRIPTHERKKMNLSQMLLDFFEES